MRIPLRQVDTLPRLHDEQNQLQQYKRAVVKAGCDAQVKDCYRSARKTSTLNAGGTPSALSQGFMHRKAMNKEEGCCGHLQKVHFGNFESCGHMKNTNAGRVA